MPIAIEAKTNVLPNVTVCPPPVRPPVANKREFAESTNANVSASPVAVTFPPVTAARTTSLPPPEADLS
jgi:hypothetical protein